MKKLLICLAAATMLSGVAQAAINPIVINEGVQTVQIPGGGTTLAYDSPGERGGNGFVEVTNNAPRGANGVPGSNGSLEIHGDRSRYVIGSIYENFNGAPAQAIIPLSALDSVSFDWQTGVNGSGQAHAAPVVRLHVMDNGNRSEVIWEYVYNGGAAGVATPTGVWNAADASAKFYVNVRDNDGAAFLSQIGNPAGYTINGGSQGEVYFNGGLYTQDLTTLKSLFTSNAIVTGFSFGAGSGFGSNFVGYVDNFAVTRGPDSTVVNWETSASAVPEPATWAMMIGGFGIAGGALRRRRSAVVATA